MAYGSGTAAGGIPSLPIGLGSSSSLTNTISLPAGSVYTVPAGQWMLGVGPYSTVQEYDSSAQAWRIYGPDAAGLRWCNSDGGNFRVVNPTGCAVGAIITTAGSGMTQAAAPTVTPSAGGSKWQPIIGGAISTTITVTNGGSGYVYPPLVVIQAPTSGPQASPTGPGLAAAATATLTTGAVSSVTVTQQGAGYQLAPTITFINDPRDTTGSGATATATLTGAGTLTGLLVTDFGTSLTAVPTLTFSVGGSAATVIMDWTLTALTLTNAGSGYTASTNLLVTSTGGIVAGTATLTNPAWDKSMFRIRPATLSTPTNGSGVLQAGSIITDGGRFQATPTLVIADGRIVGGPVTTAAQLTPVMGGVTDTLLLFAAPK